MALINEFTFKEEFLKRIHLILRSHEVSFENNGSDFNYIESEEIPEILRKISTEFDKLINYGK